MKPIKIFLASSSELKTEREQFEIFINRKNNILKKRGFLKIKKLKIIKNKDKAIKRIFKTGSRLLLV